MDDVMGRIQEMLSDEESMQQIKELADMLSASSAPSEQPPPANNRNNSNNNNNNNNDIGFDFSMIFKIQEIMSAAKSDKDAELIMALKPHLSAEKQERADKAVKFMKLFSVWETLKSSGMLNDLNKFL